MITKRSLFKELSMDLNAMDGKAIKKILFTVEFWLLLSYRIQHRLVTWPRPFRWLVMPMRFWTQILTGCFIHWDAKIEGGVKIIHATGICIGVAEIGSGTAIFQHVTLGTKATGKVEFPTIGKNCAIYAGAVVVGAVNIGDNVVIAANCVVTKNLMANDIVGGIPAKSLKRTIA